MEVNERKRVAPVLIIGGGPTGLSLALGLARYKIRTILIEKNRNISDQSKAPVVHLRTREILEHWGMGEKFLTVGNLVRKLEIKSSDDEKILFSLNFEELEDEAHLPGILIIEQSETEKILLESLKETGLCDIRFDQEAVFIEPKKDEVLVKVTTPQGDENFYGQYVIGCDGASSFVRDSLKMKFEGFTYSVRTVLADIKIEDQRDDLPWPRFYNGRNQVTVGIQIRSGFWRIIHLESGISEEQEKKQEISPSEVKEWVQQVLGAGEFDLVWASPFKIHRRSTPHFRMGRIFLAGDAAHVHSPVGGQGMNAGIQDSHNLAWKLAAALSEEKNSELLKSYETERKAAVVKKVSGYTDFITKVFLQSPLIVRKASFFILRRVLSVPFLRIKFLRRLTMTNLGYKNSEIHFSSNPPSGMRIPNVKLQSPTGDVVRLYELLPLGFSIVALGKKPIFEDLPVVKIGGFRNYIDNSGLLANLLKNRAGWLLIRPDMHIAWAGNKKKELKKAIENSPLFSDSIIFKFI